MTMTSEIVPRDPVTGEIDQEWLESQPPPKYLRRDYYWKMVGWRWQVWRQVGDRHERVGALQFWWWRTAARVTNEIFAAYHDGRDAERGRIR